MTRRSLADWILRLYPRAWRDRYVDEVRDLVDELSAKGELSTIRSASGLVVAALVQRVRAWQWSWRSLAISGSALAFAATVVIALSGPGPGHLSGSMVGLTKGTIPSSTGGTIDTKKIPDFISAVGRDGKIVGYIPRAYIVPAPANQPMSSKIGSVAPVYASNPKTLVGHFYPGVGFVPLGQSPASEPCIPEATSGRSANGQTISGSIACPSTAETVPNIVGTYLPTAMGELSAQSLTASIDYVHSKSISGGHVIAVTPAPGSKVPARSVLTVVSSLGPSTGGGASPPAQSEPTSVSVPNTIGVSQAEACAILQASGLSCSVKTDSSSSAGIGHVFSQAPFAGAHVASQSTVVITVSAGP